MFERERICCLASHAKGLEWNGGSARTREWGGGAVGGNLPERANGMAKAMRAFETGGEELAGGPTSIKMA